MVAALPLQVQERDCLPRHVSVLILTLPFDDIQPRGRVQQLQAARRPAAPRTARSLAAAASPSPSRRCRRCCACRRCGSAGAAHGARSAGMPPMVTVVVGSLGRGHRRRGSSTASTAASRSALVASASTSGACRTPVLDQRVERDLPGAGGHHAVARHQRRTCGRHSAPACRRRWWRASGSLRSSPCPRTRTTSSAWRSG